MTITESDRFPLNSSVGTDTHPEERLFWLHLRITTGPVSTAFALIQGAGDWLSYCGGDSFAEWAEPFDQAKADLLDNQGRALHIAFDADSAEDAIRKGERFARAAGVTSGFDAVVTTGRDWADGHLSVFALTADEAEEYRARLTRDLYQRPIDEGHAPYITKQRIEDLVEGSLIPPLQR